MVYLWFGSISIFLYLSFYSSGDFGLAKDMTEKDYATIAGTKFKQNFHLFLIVTRIN